MSRGLCVTFVVLSARSCIFSILYKDLDEQNCQTKGQLKFWVYKIIKNNFFFLKIHEFLYSSNGI